MKRSREPSSASASDADDANIQIYVVTMVRFVDDYKFRGHDAARIETVRVFRSEAAARAEEAALEKEEVVRYLQEEASDEDKRGYVTDGKVDLEAVEANFGDVFELAQKGEYVPVRFDVRVRAVWLTD